RFTWIDPYILGLYNIGQILQVDRSTEIFISLLSARSTHLYKAKEQNNTSMMDILQQSHDTLSKYDLFSEPTNYPFPKYQKRHDISLLTDYLNLTVDSRSYGQPTTIPVEPPTTTCHAEVAQPIYMAPCEHHVCRHRQNYLINDALPKATSNCSIIELGVCTSDFRPLAFKTVLDRKLADREIQVLTTLGRVPHLVYMEDTFLNDRNEQVIVLPMLKKLGISQKDLVDIARTMRQLFSALFTMHNHQIIHLDVTPSNLMQDNSDSLVLIDFGLSHQVHPSIPALTTARGTAGYIAPELFNCPSSIDAKVDIYSAGIILGQMLDGYLPSDLGLHLLGGLAVRCDTTEQIAMNINEFLLTRRTSGTYSSYPPTTTHSDPYPQVLYHAAELLAGMLMTDPCLRPSAKECLQSQFLTAKVEQFVDTQRNVVQERVRVFCYYREQARCGYGFGGSYGGSSYFGGYREVERYR
ncbi:kinase-like domain-containing protein, partial [Endogone sp. FLAS-F59071]